MLIAKVGALRCALPLSCVVETMRPLPLRALAGAPEFVSGAAVIRGQGVPVVDLATLLGTGSAAATRFIVARAGQRSVALAVEAVIGIREIAGEALAHIPPLLSQVQASSLTAIGALDKELLLVLQTSHIVPDDVWPLLDRSNQ